MSRPSFFQHLHPPKIPAEQARFRYTLGLGGLAVFLLIVVAATGALLLFYFTPTVEGANASVQLITYHVPLGWLIRNLHFWASQGLVVVAILHLLRVALTGGFRPPRRFNWLLGIGLLLLTLGLDFTGYALRWDADIGWALLVGTNLLREIPLIGEGIYQLAVGGSVINEATVVRFYGWHIFGLLLPAAILAIWHLFRVRRDGGISAPKPEPGKRLERVARDVLVRREVIAMLLASAALLVMATLFNPNLSASFDPNQAVEKAQAPWFFLWIQALLRWGDPLWMGILIPVAVLLLLSLLPYAIDRGVETGRWFPTDGRAAQGVALSLVLVLTILTLLGAAR